MKKKLKLHRETLRHLDPKELQGVAGGVINTITLWPTACECETRNTDATSQCTGSDCTEDNTKCLCPVC